MKQVNKCCICGKEFQGYGNNPSPVKESGLCCEYCNVHVVIPRRIKDLLKKNGRKLA